MTDQLESTFPQTGVAIDITKRRHVVLAEFSHGGRRHYRLRRRLEEGHLSAVETEEEDRYQVSTEANTLDIRRRSHRTRTRGRAISVQR